MPEQRSISDMITERLGAVDDDVIEAIAREFPVEGSPAPGGAHPQVPAPAAETAPEPEAPVSRDDFLRYHALRQTDPSRFDAVVAKMREFAEFDPEAGRKWDGNYAAFNGAYRDFDRGLHKAEYFARTGQVLRFKDEVAAEDAADLARNGEKAKLERQRQAEADEETRTRQALKTAQADRDRLGEAAILERMAEKLLEGKR